MVPVKGNAPDHSIPILISVTGHREPIPGDIDKIKNAIGEEYKNIRTLCGAEAPNTRIILLIGLAEGVDRLAAEAAGDCGVEVPTVSSMPCIGGSFEPFHWTRDTLGNTASMTITVTPVF